MSATFWARSEHHSFAIATVGMSSSPLMCSSMHSSTKDRATRASVATSASLNLVFWKPQIGRPNAVRSCT